MQRAIETPSPDSDQRARCIARALRVKRVNALTTLLVGGTLVLLSAFWRPAGLTPLTFFLGLLLGLVYANGFEYVLHRFLLHWGNGFLVQRHALHHDSAGAPNEARYVNFASSPLVAVLVLLLNVPAALLAQRFLHAGLAPGTLAGFTFYFLAYEEIHWRMHMGGWLPHWMGFARRHHMLHHGEFKGRYNVFFPLFDWIFERHRWLANTPQHPARETNRRPV